MITRAINSATKRFTLPHYQIKSWEIIARFFRGSLLFCSPGASLPSPPPQPPTKTVLLSLNTPTSQLASFVKQARQTLGPADGGRETTGRRLCRGREPGISRRCLRLHSRADLHGKGTKLGLAVQPLQDLRLSNFSAVSLYDLSSH